MSYHVYSADDFKTLFKAMDSFLTKKSEIILIGGSAALLAYKATRLTQDIDSFNNIQSLTQAYEKAKAKTGLEIPMSQASVADAPYNFEDRLVDYTELSLKNLNVKIPEIHDFILMKTVRGYEHDLAVVEEITKKNKVQKDLLIKRFETEMDHVIGDSSKLELNFAAMLSKCFGEAAGQNWKSTYNKK